MLGFNNEMLRRGLEKNGKTQDERRKLSEMQSYFKKELSNVVIIKNLKILRKEAYKYYAALGKTENLFSINKLTLSDFIAHKISLYEGDKLTEMDITFMTIKGKPKTGKFQPKTALVRYEFIELLWRLALKRYYDS